MDQMTPDLEEALRTPEVRPPWVAAGHTAHEWAEMGDAVRVAIIRFECPTVQPGQKEAEVQMSMRLRESTDRHNRESGRVHVFHGGGPVGGLTPF